MRVNDGCLYPFPFFRTKSEDYIDGQFDFDGTLIYDADFATLDGVVNINDDAIKKAIQTGMFAVFCHVDCPSTKYRACLDISNSFQKFELKLPSHLLMNNVEIICLLVAMQDVKGFSDRNLISFYGNSVDFPIYAKIGRSNQIVFSVSKEHSIKGEIPSIFSITFSDVDEMRYDCDRNQIMIYIPRKSYEQYNYFKSIDPKTKITMLVFPVLLDILNLLKSRDETGEICDRGTYDNLAWFAVLAEKLDGLGYSVVEIDGPFDKESSYVLAQKLIPRLCLDAFDEFNASHIIK